MIPYSVELERDVHYEFLLAGKTIDLDPAIIAGILLSDYQSFRSLENFLNDVNLVSKGEWITCHNFSPGHHKRSTVIGL